MNLGEKFILFGIKNIIHLIYYKFEGGKKIFYNKNNKNL